MNKQKLPEGWKEVELGKLFTFQKKSTIKAGEGLSKGKYKFFTSSDKQTKFIDKYTQNGEFLIFATGGHAGVHYCNDKFATSTDCFIAKVDDKVMAKYVYYYLFSQIHILEEGFKGAGLKHISKGYIEDIKIIYPENKETQKKIVSILEKAEKAKEWRKEADDLTKDFLKSVFLEMFKDKGNFENRKLIDICNVQSGGTPSRTKKEYWNNGNIPWLGSTVCKDKYVNQSKQFITEEGLKNSSARLFKKGTILVALVGATIGKTAYLNFEATTNQNIAGIYPKEGIDLNSEYLFYAMQTLYYRFMSLSSDTFKMANLTFIRNLEIPLPPISLQNKFASIVKEVEAMKEQQKHSKDHIDNLFNALMQKAFKGELKC